MTARVLNQARSDADDVLLILVRFSRSRPWIGKHEKEVARISASIPGAQTECF